jgi:uncharacterized protein YndB with AHSA1/START domain
VTREVGVEGHRRIRAPVQRVWQLLARPESLPRYLSLWMAADVLERSGASALVEFRGFLGGLPVTSLQRLTLRAPTRLEFRQVRGELLHLGGSITLREVDGETEVTYQIAIEPGIPLFTEGSVLQILAAHVDVLLGRLKAAAERDLVRLGGRRRFGGEVAGAVASPEPDAKAEGAQAGGEDTDTAQPAPAPAGGAGLRAPDASAHRPVAGGHGEAPAVGQDADTPAPAPSAAAAHPGPGAGGLRGDRGRRRRRRRRRPPAPPRQPAGP